MAKARSKKNTAIANSATNTEGLAQFERMLPRAESEFGAQKVMTFRIDPILALHNVREGVGAVLEEQARARAELPKLDLARVKQLPELALAVAYAARRAESERQTQQSSREIERKLRRTQELRQLLLAAAESLALAGHLPKARVARIRAGRGALDAAQDCVELAALFQKSASAVRGRSPVTREQITEAATLGSELLQAIKPARTRRTSQKNSDAVDAAAARDRLGALLLSEHDTLRRAGFWLFGREADTRVPPLASHAGARKSKKSAETPPTS